MDKPMSLNTALLIKQAAFGQAPAKVMAWLVAHGYATREPRYGGIYVTGAATEEAAKRLNREKYGAGQ